MAELGKLTAIFDADTRQFDKGIKSVDAGIKGTVTSLDALGNKWKAAAAISVAAAGAIGGVTASLFSAAKNAAAFGGGLTDLSQRTGITVGTLSTLKVAADQSGASIEGINKALGKYLANISNANSGNETLIAKLKSVGFTAEDLNKAYGDSDAAVTLLIDKVKSLGNEQDQLNLLQKAGVKNAQELLGVINGMTGSFAQLRKEAERLGLVITPEQAEAADKFDDSLKILELQVKAMANSIAFQYLPQITGAITDISNALASNKQGWAAWGDFIRTEIRGVRVAAAGIAAFIANIPALGVGGAALIGVATGVATSRRLHLEEGLGAGVSVGAGILRRPSGFTPTGGGGGGGGGAAKEDPGVQLLKQLEEQFRNLTPRTEAEKVAQQLLAKEFNNTSDKLKRLIQTTAIEIDQQTKILAITRERYATQVNINRLEDEAIARQRALELTRERVIGNRPRRVGNVVPGDVIDLGGGSFFGEGGTGGGRERIATVNEQVARERLQMIREQMVILGNDLTQIFSSSIQAGFEQGAARGLASLAQGLLNVVQNVFLKRLAEGLGNILNQSAQGGGFWGGLLRSIVPGLVGGAVGGLTGVSGLLSAGRSVGPLSTSTVPLTSGLITRASGGPVSAGMPYLVGERGPEMFIPGQSGNINSNAGMTININVPVKSAGSYSSPKSRRELAQSVAQALQGAIS